MPGTRCCAHYATEPRNVDAVTGLASTLEQKSSFEPFEAALAVLGAFPDPTANDGNGDFDDSFVHVVGLYSC